MNISIEQAKELLDSSYCLVYIDYRDTLDDSLDVIQRCIQEKELSYLDEKIGEWIMDHEQESLDQTLAELQKEIVERYEADPDDVAALIEEHRDSIVETIFERDNSSPLKGLLRNTRDPVCFYDLDYVNTPDGEVDETVDEIKQMLNITDDKSDKALYDLVINCFDARNLVVFFRMEIKDLLNLGDENLVTFKNPMLALIDVGVGTGWHSELHGREITLPFTPENVFLDKTIKYSYTYSVCGMSDDWCDCTGISFSKAEDVEPPEISHIHGHIDLERRFNEVYRSGKCSYGDHDMKRHRNVKYINEFPCGSHCMDCGQFWID